MSSSDALPSAAATAAAVRPIRAELIETIRLALPIALTQLGQIGMMTTDLALIGRLGDAAIAAASLAHTVFFAVFVLGMGVMSAVAPLVAQAFGARDPRTIRRSFRVGLWLAVFMTVGADAGAAAGRRDPVALGQTPESSKLAARYLEGLTWSLLPGWWFIAIRGFMGSVNRPEPALWITLVAIPTNALLGYALIYGEFGLPNFDLLGAGLATTIVNIAMCIAGFWIAHVRRPFRKFHPLGNFWRIDWRLLWQLIAVGAPISGSFLLEYGLFSSAAILMGWIGTAELAAHQIALQTAAVLFMVPYGISMAATVRVGQAVGRGDTGGTRRAGFVAIALAGIFMAFMTMVVIASRFEIASFFLGSTAAGFARGRHGRIAAGGRHDILYLRRLADRGGRRLAWFERHRCAAGVRRHQLLGDRLLGVLWPRVPAQARRGRRLDRLFVQPRRVRNAADPALSPPDRARVSAADGTSLVTRG